MIRTGKVSVNELMGGSQSANIEQHHQYRLSRFAFHDGRAPFSGNFRASFPPFLPQGLGARANQHPELLFRPPYFGGLPPLSPMFPLIPNIGPRPLSPDMHRLPMTCLSAAAGNIPMHTSPPLQLKPKKNFFMPYMNPEAVERGLNSKHLIKVSDLVHKK
jgi:hypothetical protein